MAEMKKKATRESYGEALAKLAGMNDKVIVFDADLAGATKTGTFKKACPGPARCTRRRPARRPGPPRRRRG